MKYFVEWFFKRKNHKRQPKIEKKKPNPDKLVRSRKKN